MEYDEDNVSSNNPIEVNLRYGLLWTLMWLLPKRLPIIAICWGYEALNVYFGGSLYQDQGKDINQKHQKCLVEIKNLENTWIHDKVGT